MGNCIINRLQTTNSNIIITPNTTSKFIRGTYVVTHLSGIVTRIQDFIDQITTDNLYTAFDVVLQGGGAYKLNGVLYPDKTYGAGIITSVWGDCRYWERNNGVDSSIDISKNNIIYNKKTGTYTPSSWAWTALSDCSITVPPGTYVILARFLITRTDSNSDIGIRVRPVDEESWFNRAKVSESGWPISVHTEIVTTFTQTTTLYIQYFSTSTVGSITKPSVVAIPI